MNIRSGATAILAETPVKLRTIPERAREMNRVVKRLQRIVADHVDGAAKIKCPLGLPDVLAVISALEAEADGLSPANHLATGEEVGTYLRSGLFEELRGEPSNILHATQISDDVVRYEAMPKDFWKECLDSLSTKLTALTSNRLIKQ